MTSRFMATFWLGWWSSLFTFSLINIKAWGPLPMVVLGATSVLMLSWVLSSPEKTT